MIYADLVEAKRVVINGDRIYNSWLMLTAEKIRLAFFFQKILVQL